MDMTDLIADLKQFIVAQLAQQLVQQTSELRAEFRTEIAKTNKKIDDLSVAVAEAIEAANEATEAQLKDHEHRIGRLEKKLA